MDHSVHEHNAVNNDHAMHMMDASTEIPVVHDHHMSSSGGMDHSAHAGHDMGHMMSMAVG